MGAILSPARIGGVPVLRAAFGSGAGALLTTGRLRNDANSVLSYTVLRFVAAYDSSTHELVAIKYGAYTDGNGVARFRAPGVVAGGLYEFNVVSADGGRVMPLAGATA